jgi:hypothetical protein
MKLFDKLTLRNFEMYAAQHYNNPEATDIEEFKEDLSRFKYLKRLLKRYEMQGDLQERLILNHLIVIYNVFGIEAADRMVWFKINKEHYGYIKPFLIFLSFLKETDKTEIQMDDNIIAKLRNI